MSRWLPDNFDAAAHNARVRSLRSEMREQHSAHRISQAGETATREPHKLEIPRSTRGPATPLCARVPASAPATVRARPKADAGHKPDAASKAPPVYPLIGLCRAAGLPDPVPEYRWHPVRKYRADYALVLERVLIEYDGGLFVNGGHSRGKARLYDMAKDRQATLLGWRTLRYGVGEMAQTVADLRILLAGGK